MRKLSLRPYLGQVWVCRSLKKLRREYERLTATTYPYEDDPSGGRFVRIERGPESETVWLVYARTPAVLAHELSHVLLHMFRIIGHDPREGDGEPFCYMLSQLMLDAGFD